MLRLNAFKLFLGKYRLSKRPRKVSNKGISWARGIILPWMILKGLDGLVFAFLLWAQGKGFKGFSPQKRHQGVLLSLTTILQWVVPFRFITGGSLLG